MIWRSDVVSHVIEYESFELFEEDLLGFTPTLWRLSGNPDAGSFVVILFDASESRCELGLLLLQLCVEFLVLSLWYLGLSSYALQDVLF